MNTFFFALLSAVALALCAARPDSPTAKTRHQMAGVLRETGWVRVIGWTLVAIGGAFLIPLVTPFRIGLHGALVAIALGASWVAVRIALKRHNLPRKPVELRS
ncbi:hypothetical protein ETD86_21565 [Nonomuraea turkmeniaca]|uniref:DUF3325 domain-containing protein n=1 Tax=Nonomuraea turkmeniaca TaxID=103838 RepID=A0A5S4FG46_9ACTN|nr:hypothetical protein [Nonomuraea turkmeniaca]TMR18541.1 hypothetical protein ETD86_21565 [Nonomuraea turkmeniaca]